MDTDPPGRSAPRRRRGGGRRTVPQEVLRRRGNSRLRRLRDAHGLIKGALIARAAGRGSRPRVVDLCCGRMGDAARYGAVRAAHVLGVDADEAALREARRRLPRAPWLRLRRADLRVPGAGAAVVEQEGEAGRCDVAVCMFALHYFFESRAALGALLEAAAAALRPGGVLVGAAPLGAAVEAALSSSSSPSSFSVGALRLERPRAWADDEESSPFGREYTFALDDDDEGGFFRALEGRRSTEYATSVAAMDAVAREHGLEPRHAEVAAAPGGGVAFAAWRAALAPDLVLRDDERAASDLNFAFAYEKKERATMNADVHTH